jgi:hypothetical protein
MTDRLPDEVTRRASAHASSSAEQASAALAEASPENDTWLRELVERSPLLPDAALRRHWRHLVPWLPVAARYELAAILLEVDRAAACD